MLLYRTRPWSTVLNLEKKCLWTKQKKRNAPKMNDRNPMETMIEQLELRV
jgi:hypothetical protein